MTHSSLAHLGHRPWPLPSRPWRWAQVWSDLAFLHWPLPARTLRPHVPLDLTIDEFGGSAWLGIVPFHLRIRHRGTPALPLVQVFPEINVRTYVTVGGRPGVWFFSLDAPSRVAVWAARRLYHLPYRRSRFTLGRDDRMLTFRSERLEAPAPATFAVRTRATGSAGLAPARTLEHFLTERYCLYAADRRGTLWRAEVHHPPWPLREGEAEIERNEMTAPLGFEVEGSPHVLLSDRIEVATWGPERLDPGFARAGRSSPTPT